MSWIPKPSKVLLFIKSHKKKIVIFLSIFIFFGSAAYGFSNTQQKLQPSLIENQSVPVAEPLQISFNQVIDSDFEPIIIPSVDGSWEKTESLIGTSSVIFKPAKRFDPDQNYSVRITNMKRLVTGADIPEYSQTFRTQGIPSVKEMTPSHGSVSVSTRPRFTVTLSEPNRGARDLKPIIKPSVTLKLISSDGITFTWEAETPLNQGTLYSFSIRDGYSTNSEDVIGSSDFTTIGQPVIKWARTGSLFNQDDVVDIIFDQKMINVDEFFEFGMKGRGSWIDSYTYRFDPEGLKPGTSYYYKIKSGIKSVGGGTLESEQSFHFITNGAVSAQLNPGGSGVKVGSIIRIAFDQDVDKASAEARFVINPKVSGKFSWSGKVLTFTPERLDYQTTYHYGVTPGIVPKWGLPNTQTLSRSFTTENPVVKLNVPAFKQQYAMSCELSALRMILAYRGINVTDWDILMKIGYNPRVRDKDANFWDNPNEMYVGFLDGWAISSGYGVHSGPVAAAARSYGRGASSHFGVSAQFIASQIHSGNPVEVWGHSTPASPYSWNTSSGVVQTTTSQHARVVYGVVGTAESPVGFHLIDPWTGGKIYWSTSQLMNNMNVALPASNQAVVVF